MPTDEECREAAGMVRRAGDKSPYVWQTIRGMLGMPKDFTLPQIQEHLADLIDPEPELTCRNVSTVGHNSSGWLFDFKCSECGAELCAEEMGNSPLWIDEEAEPISYCPSCGAKVVDDGD